jgi:hypothetical protein
LIGRDGFDVSLALAFIALGVLILRRGLAGYPKTIRRFEFLARREEAFLAAAAEVLFPATDALSLSGGEADLPGYADRYLEVLPVRQRNLLRALFFLFEQGTLIWPAPGRGGFKRFSGLSPHQRLAVLRNWESSRLYLRRMCLTALKAVLILGYVGHPQSLGALGLAPWKIESPRIEADFLYPPIGQGRDGLPDSSLSSSSSPLSPPLVPGVDQEAS